MAIVLRAVRGCRAIGAFKKPRDVLTPGRQRSYFVAREQCQLKTLTSLIRLVRVLVDTPWLRRTTCSYNVKRFGSRASSRMVDQHGRLEAAGCSEVSGPGRLA